MAAEVILCDPCLFVEIETEAIGFCGTCAEYLCSGCINEHRKAKMTRSHKIQQENIPRNAEIIKAMNEMKVCTFHKEMNITYSCNDHDAYVCTACRVDTHRKCENVFEIAKAEESGSDLKDIQQKLAEVEEAAVSIRKEREENKTDLNQTQSNILSEQEAIIQRAISSLEELRVKYKRETNEKVEVALSEIKEDIDAVEVIERNTVRNRDIVDAALKYDDGICLKVIAHRLAGKVRTLKNDVRKIQEKGHLKLSFEGNADCIAVSSLGVLSVKHCKTDGSESEKCCRIDINKTSDELLESDLTNSTIIGETVEETLPSPSTMDTIFDTNGLLFNVKGAADNKTCTIVGSVVLPDGQIVVIDFGNSSIKLLSSDFVILDVLRLPGKPIHICATGSSTIAVSFERVKRINWYSVDGSLINYNGGFPTKLFNHGIAYDGNNIVALMSDVDHSCSNSARADTIQVEVRDVCNGNIVNVIRDFRVVGKTSWSLVLKNTQAICFTAENYMIIAETNRVLLFFLTQESTQTVAIEKNFYVCSGEVERDSIVNIATDSDSIYVCTNSGRVLQLSIDAFETYRISFPVVGKVVRCFTLDNIYNRAILGYADDDNMHIHSLTEILE